MLAPGATAVILDQPRVPPLASRPGGGYPPDPVAELARRRPDLRLIVRGRGEDTPEAPLQGVFLVGALSPQLPLSSGHWRMAIDAVVPERHRAANLAAWRRGAGAGSDARGV
jgi:hypothetical protein